MQAPIAGAEPADGGEEVVTGAAVLKLGFLQERFCRNDPFGSNEPMNLDPE
jgi:hypothetical protein